MSTKVIALTNAQREQLGDELFKIACDCQLREDDNVQYGETEVEIDNEIYIVEYSIRCVSGWETSATYYQPAEGGSEIDVRVERMYAYGEDDNEIEVEITNDVFEYEFEY